MNFIDKEQKLDYLLELITKECTGNTKDLSQCICVSKRTLLRYIKELRIMGYQISFCLQRNTYYLIGETKKMQKVSLLSRR